MTNLLELRKLRKEVEGLKYSINNMKPEVQADYYKDYRTGKGIPKPLIGLAYDEEKLISREKKLSLRLKQIAKVIEKAEAEIESIKDPEDRTMARLYYIEELSMEDIARNLHCDKSTVSRKLKKLQQMQQNNVL